MREGYSHNPFDFGAWLRFDPATVQKSKFLPNPNPHHCHSLQVDARSRVSAQFDYQIGNQGQWHHFIRVIITAMKKRRVNWAFGNPGCTAWEVETAAGLLVVRRNHALVRAGARWCQGWDVWLGGKFAGALSSRTLSDLATLSRGELLAVLRTACCGRHREFQDDQPRLPSAKRGGGARPNAGRRTRGEAKRVQISAMVEPRTLELIDQERGERSRGQYLDWLVRRRRRRQSVS